MAKEKILNVKFNVLPDVRIRVIDPEKDTVTTIKNKKQFPFKSDNEVFVTVTTTEREFTFRIYAGYAWNGADIPKTLFLFGQSKENHYLIASMVHDYMLEYKELIYKDTLKECMKISEYRRLTSLIFREILKCHKTNVIKANCMAWSVDVFQMTLNRGSWKV